MDNAFSSGIYHDITYADNDNRFARTTHRNDNRVVDNLQCSELGHNYNAFESASNGVIIKAIKNNTVVSKTVKLPQENIIINGQLNEYAKIIKIEYRETTKEFKYHTGTFNEIKVTIDGTKTAGDKEELEGLFK